MAAPSSSVSANHFMLTTHTSCDDEFKEYIRNNRIGFEVTFIRDKGKKYQILVKRPGFDSLKDMVIELHEYATRIYRERIEEVNCLPSFAKNREINNLNILLGEIHDWSWYQRAKFTDVLETGYSISRSIRPLISIRLLLCVSRVNKIVGLYGPEGLNGFYEYINPSRLISLAAGETAREMNPACLTKSDGIGGRSRSENRPKYLENAISTHPACTKVGGGGGGGSSDVGDSPKDLDKSSSECKPVRGKSPHLYSDVELFEKGYSAFTKELVSTRKENIDFTKHRWVQSRDLLVYLFPDFFTQDVIGKDAVELKALEEKNAEVFLFIKEVVERHFARDTEALKPSRIEAYMQFLQGVLERVSVEVEEIGLFPAGGVHDLSISDVIKMVEVYIKKETSFFLDISSESIIHVGKGTTIFLATGDTYTTYHPSSRIHFSPDSSNARESREWMEHNKETLEKVSYFGYRGYGGEAIEWFPYGFFTYFPNVEEIDIRNSALSKFPSDTFNGLANLKKLILQYIKLKTLPGDIFNELGSLNELFLNYCNIESLPDGIFQRLRNLRKLDLSQNQINKVERSLFARLSVLEELNLSFNKLKKIPDYCFAGVGSSLHVHLECNEPGLKESFTCMTFGESSLFFKYSI